MNEGLRGIGIDSFGDCSSLKSFVLPSSVTKVVGKIQSSDKMATVAPP